MRCRLFIIDDAEEDLYGIYKYIATYDSAEKAVKLINKLKETCKSLSQFVNRGHVPPELERIGIFDYREIHYKSYRIIYNIIQSSVNIHCVLDGRRDLQSLLEERLLR